MGWIVVIAAIVAILAVGLVLDLRARRTRGRTPQVNMPSMTARKAEARAMRSSRGALINHDTYRARRPDEDRNQAN